MSPTRPPVPLMLVNQSFWSILEDKNECFRSSCRSGRSFDNRGHFECPPARLHQHLLSTLQLTSITFPSFSTFSFMVVLNVAYRVEPGRTDTAAGRRHAGLRWTYLLSLFTNTNTCSSSTCSSTTASSCPEKSGQSLSLSRPGGRLHVPGHSDRFHLLRGEFVVTNNLKIILKSS